MDWVTRRVLQGLSESDNIKIHWQIDLFHRIPEAQGFTGWLLKPLAHHLIENTSEGFWPLANMKSKYSDPPHFTLDHNSPVLDNVKFIKVRCKMIKLQSIANLSACLENNAYYVPEDPNSNSPLFHLEKPKPYILHYCTQYNKFTLMDQKNTLWCTIL